MFKKIMSVMLAVVMLMSVAVMATSAAQVEIADNSAEAIAEVAADAAADTGADASAETGAAKTLTFEVNTTNWKNFTTVYCHIWVYGGDPIYAFKAKAEKCTDNGDGTWTYDLDAKGVTLEDGVLYAVLFGNENGMQTYNLLFDTSVLGDTAYCDGTEYENPVDSTKSTAAAFWRGQDSSKYGPEMCVTSIGNVVGTCIPYTTSAQAMFVGFLQDTLGNARIYSGKDDQTLVDDTAKALGLKIGNVEEAIAAAGVDVEWDSSKSSLQEGTDDSAKQDGSGNVVKTPDDAKGNTGSGSSTSSGSDSSTSSGSDSSTGSSSGSSSSSSSTKTGSGSTTKTGQETTVLYIMLGVMIAAAAVIVIARKKTRA